MPLSDRHFAASDEWRRLAGGKTVIDASFPMLAHHSPEFVKAAKAAARDADIVVFSHPWVYPLVSDVLRWQRASSIVYDAQNVESVLRYRLLGRQRDRPAHREARHRRGARTVPPRRPRAGLLARGSGPVPSPLRDSVRQVPRDAERHVRRRSAVRVARVVTRSAGWAWPTQPLAIFIGSLYPAKRRSGRVSSARSWRRRCRRSRFAICGGVGGAIDGDALARRGIGNVRVTGTLDDAARREYLGAADVAVNPMFSGSGTNIKMFDFMAAGLPVISTPTGARGINLVRIRACTSARRVNSPARSVADSRRPGVRAASGHGRAATGV